MVINFHLDMTIRLRS